MFHFTGPLFKDGAIQTETHHEDSWDYFNPDRYLYTLPASGLAPLGMESMRNLNREIRRAEQTLRHLTRVEKILSPLSDRRSALSLLNHYRKEVGLGPMTQYSAESFEETKGQIENAIQTAKSITLTPSNEGIGDFLKKLLSKEDAKVVTGDEKQPKLVVVKNNEGWLAKGNLVDVPHLGKDDWLAETNKDMEKILSLGDQAIKFFDVYAKACGEFRSLMKAAASEDWDEDHFIDALRTIEDKTTSKIEKATGSFRTHVFFHSDVRANEKGVSVSVPDENEVKRYQVLKPKVTALLKKTSDMFNGNHPDDLTEVYQKFAEQSGITDPDDGLYDITYSLGDVGYDLAECYEFCYGVDFYFEAIDRLLEIITEKES